MILAPIIKKNTNQVANIRQLDSLAKLLVLSAISALTTGCVASSLESISLSPQHSYVQKSSKLETEPAVKIEAKAATEPSAKLTGAPIPVKKPQKPVKKSQKNEVTQNIRAQEGPSQAVSTKIKEAANKSSTFSIVNLFKKPEKKPESVASYVPEKSNQPSTKIQTSGQTLKSVLSTKKNNGTVIDFEKTKNQEKTGARIPILKKAGSIQLASVAGLSRLSEDGINLQHTGVEVSCLRPELMQILRKVQKRFGRPVIISSGFRTHKRNRRIGGARGSRHTRCEAVDIQLKGISKWDVAKYLRTLPERGGVGTYCHTRSVHIDIGTKRDWNWRCRKRRKRKK